MPRLFVAIEIKPSNEIHTLIDILKNALAQSTINWIKEENLHLTLKFLGEVPSYSIHTIQHLLRDISKKHSSFTIAPSNLGHFGALSKPFTLWHGYKPCLELVTLQQDIEKEFDEVGYKSNNLSYEPHLTLARVKQLIEFDSFQSILNTNSLKDSSNKISGFKLLESTLFATGPVYKNIERFELNSN